MLESDRHSVRTVTFDDAVENIWDKLSEVCMHYPNGAEASYLKSVLDALISGKIKPQEAIDEVDGTTLDDKVSFN